MPKDRASIQHGQIVEWLARLPLLRLDQLAVLLGEPVESVEPVLREMERRGWVDWVESSSLELEPGRLYLLTEPVRTWLAKTSGPEGTASLPLAPPEILARLVRIETAAALNRFAAALAAAARRADQVELTDIRSLPVRRRADAWWPPGVQGFASLTSGPGTTSFFVVVDRSTVPAAHRSNTVAGWYRHAETKGLNLPGGDPAILVICGEPQQEEQWARAVRDAAERRGVPRLKVFLTTTSSPGSDTLLSPIWRQPGGDPRTSLTVGLAWSQGPLGYAPPTAATTHSELPEVSEPVHLHDWAKQVLPAVRAKRCHSGRAEQLAALSISTTAEQKLLLETVGRIPLLTESDLRLVLGLQRLLVRRLIDRSLIQCLIKMARSQSSVDETSDPRFFLTELGLRLLAAREGVPFRRFAEHGHLAAELPGAHGGRLQTLLRQLDHTVGANSFFVRCLAQRTENGPRLTRWLSSFEGAIRFDVGGGHRWLRPDGAGEVEMDGRSYPFFLEWDRGTERIAVLMEKLDRYAAYYRTSVVYSEPPQLLIVTTTPQREDVVWKAARVALGKDRLPHGLVLTSTEALMGVFGPFGSVWLAGRSGSRRRWRRQAAPRFRPSAAGRQSAHQDNETKGSVDLMNAMVDTEPGEGDE